MMIDRILPIPRQFEYLAGADVLLGKPGEAMYRLETQSLPDDPLAQSAVSLLQEELTGILNTAAGDALTGIPIRLEIGLAPAEVKHPEQAYRLEVTPAAITVTGFGVPGLYYGVITLKQCLKLEQNVLKLPCLRILDWPDFQRRGHFMESRYGSNLMTLADWKHLVDHLANQKMNQLAVSLYGCWCVQYDGRVSEYLYVPLKKYPRLQTPVVVRYFSARTGRWIDRETLPPMFEQDFFGELVAYGKTRGVTVFPLFNSYGHNTLIPAAYPEVSAKDENDQPTLTGFCTSNPQTYDLLFAIYDEIIDRYLAPNQIDSFHIGLDEVGEGIAMNADDIFRVRSPWCQCPKCRGSSKKDLLINHAVKIARHLKSRGMKHIYLYADMFTGHRYSSVEASCTGMAQALKDQGLTDVVVTDWWTYAAHQDKLMFQTTHPELGLRRTVKPWNGYYHWTLLTNPLANIYLLAKLGFDENAEGMQSYSAWDESYDRNHACLADYSWNFAGTGSTEQMTDHYVRHHFGAQFAKARRACKLFDLITEDQQDKYEDSQPVLSNYQLMLQTLSYYFYSYVRAGKPYPRAFPGEALATAAAGRTEIDRALPAIASMAREALQLWEEVAADPSCNRPLASRYAYEADNYLCLAEDYLALLKMMDLWQSAGPEKLAGIRTAAGARRQARLLLMARLEETKEHFLMASHLRNHSIFMQFFADLEGYIAATDPADVQLDFFDMRYLQSEAFRKLR